MSTLIGKENHTSASFIETVVSGNSNASSVASSPDDYDVDEQTAAPAFKTIAAAAATATATNSILTNLSRLNHLTTAAAATNNNYRKEMGGFSIPHHSLSAAFYGYHSHTNDTTSTGGNNPSTIHHPYSSNTTTTTSNIIPSVSTTSTAFNQSSFNSNKSSPFLLPAQLYKSLFANAVLHNPDKMCSHPFPRNLLFSYSDKSPNSPDFEHEEKHSISDEVSF